SVKENAPEWNAFFTQAICEFLLKDEVTPGEIDAAEEAWLIAKVKNDGQVDDAEKALLRAIKAQANKFPASLEALL
ncbi:MAG: TerB family tellurite resistance protein, partial [Muribaculaceae bacterium]|nr:TerB family tellurite resistance protein [Muribaculaceae bacterium]